MSRFLLILLFLVCIEASANETVSGTQFDILLGPSLSDRTITISDKNSSMEVAKLKSDGLNLTPSISISTQSKYLWEDKNWSYTFSTNLVSTKLDNQVRGEGDSLEDVGTEIEGLSVYFTPILYYQFGREAPEKWQYRLGIGAGVGYQNHNGAFLVTNSEHPNYGSVEKVNRAGLGLSVGLYFEASYKRHHIIFNGDLITSKPSGFNYQYSENNFSIKYQYRIHSFMLEI